MMTILMILGIVVVLVVGLILLVLLLNRRAAKQASLTAVVDIYPSGKSHVEFVPSSGYETKQLMKLALLYAAKIRYVQSGENPQIVELYERLMDEIVAPLDLAEPSKLAERLSDFAGTFQEQIDAPAATGTGERFTIRLIEGRTGDFIHNDLPLRGMAANPPMSVLLVMNAVVSRLSKRETQIFQQSLADLHRVMFNNNKPQLSVLNRTALVALNQAFAKIQ